MSRQKKRTMRKYNRSQRKNNTRRKTHKKRVRKTHKKRVRRTHKRMKGGSLQEGLKSGGDTRSFFQKTAQSLRNKAQSVRNVFTPVKVDDSISASQYQLDDSTFSSAAQQQQGQQVQISDEELKASPEMMDALQQLTLEQLKRTNPELAAQFIKVLGAQQSEPQKKQLIINYAKGAAPYLFATGLFQPYLLAGALSAVGLTVAAAAVGKLTAFLASKAGKAVFKAGKAATALVGSTKDKLKLKALEKNIEQCLAKLVFYAVISDDAKKLILEKFITNTGLTKTITTNWEARKDQRSARTKAVTNRNQENFSLNVSETPVVGETPVVQVPSLEEPGVTMATQVNTAPAEVSTAVATPEEDLLGLSQLQPSTSLETPQSAFDFINPTTTQPAEAGFTPALGSNLTQ